MPIRINGLAKTTYGADNVFFRSGNTYETVRVWNEILP